MTTQVCHASARRSAFVKLHCSLDCAELRLGAVNFDAIMTTMNKGVEDVIGSLQRNFLTVQTGRVQTGACMRTRTRMIRTCSCAHARCAAAVRTRTSAYA